MNIRSSLFLILTYLSWPLANYAYATENVAWSTQAGNSPISSYTVGSGINVNNSNVYVAGYTTASSLNGQNLIGSTDSFLVKYDTSGNLLWTALNGAANGSTNALGVTSDANSNAYIAGWTTVGLNDQNQTGVYDYFVTKYNSSGSVLWSRQAGAQNGRTDASAVATDQQGNIYVVGTTDKGINFNKFIGVEDSFIAKYSANGDLLWLKEYGVSNEATYFNSLSTDQYGNIYVAGFGGTSTTGDKDTQNNHYLVLKYDSNGNLIWLQQSSNSNTSNVEATGVGIANSGDVYITGYFNGSISNTSVHANNIGYFLAKYNHTGQLAWIKQATTGGVTAATSISVNQNEIYIGGYTTVDINNPSHTPITTDTSTTDYFVAQYDNNGHVVWLTQQGAVDSGNDSITDLYGIYANSSGIYLTGGTDGSLFNNTYSGKYDYYVVAYQ